MPKVKTFYFSVAVVGQQMDGRQKIIPMTIKFLTYLKKQNQSWFWRLVDSVSMSLKKEKV